MHKKSILIIQKPRFHFGQYTIRVGILLQKAPLCKGSCQKSSIFDRGVVGDGFPGVRAFHMSGKVEVESGMRFRREGVPMGLPGLDEWHIQQTGRENVRGARLALDM